MHQVLARIAVAALSVVACGNSGGSAGTLAGAPGSAGHAEAGEAAGGTANGGSANLGGSAAAGDQGEGGTPEPLLQSRLALGTEFGCAIGVSGSLECWGSDEQATGQTEPPGGTYRQVRAGHQAACAIREGDFVDCWGASVVSVGTETLDAAVQFQQECLLRSSRSILCLGPPKTWPSRPANKSDHSRVLRRATASVAVCGKTGRCIAGAATRAAWFRICRPASSPTLRRVPITPAPFGGAIGPSPAGAPATRTTPMVAIRS